MTTGPCGAPPRPCGAGAAAAVGGGVGGCAGGRLLPGARRPGSTSRPDAIVATRLLLSVNVHFHEVRSPVHPVPVLRGAMVRSTPAPTVPQRTRPARASGPLRRARCTHTDDKGLAFHVSFGTEGVDRCAARGERSNVAVACTTVAVIAGRLGRQRGRLASGDWTCPWSKRRSGASNHGSRTRGSASGRRRRGRTKAR